MNFTFHPEAEIELYEAVDYYDAIEFGLGLKFVDVASAAVMNILQYPESRAIDKRGTRRYVLSRFPYSLLYRIRDEGIYFIAVAHNKRNPSAFRSRHE